MDVEEGLRKVLDRQYEKQKETYGGFATFAWIGSGVLLLFIDEKFFLFSWQALAYFLIGTFAAALLLGGAFYGTQRALAKMLALFISQPSSGAAAIVGLLGFLLMILQAVVAFLVARYTIGLIT